MSDAHLNEYSSTEREHLDYMRAAIKERGYTRAAELGTYTGGSLLHIATALQDNGGGIVYAIEQEHTSLEKAQQAFNRYKSTAFPDVELRTRCESCPEAIHWLPDELDVVFVDDLHDPEHVEEELDLLLPKMKPGGTIFGHDTNNPAGIGAVFKRRGGVTHDFGFGLGELQT